MPLEVQGCLGVPVSGLAGNVVTFRRVKSKLRKAAGSQRTWRYGGDRDGSAKQRMSVAFGAGRDSVRREAQPFRRLNRGERCLPGH